MNHILLAAPTSNYKDYCMVAWIKWITTDFSVLPYDILIVDNSKDDTYHETIKKELGDKGKVLHLPYKKGRTIHNTIAESNELIRQYFIENKYDYLFFNESDVFAPKNTIEYLLQLNKYVVGLPYFISHHYQSRLITYTFERAGYIRSSLNKTLQKSFIEFNGQIVNSNNIGLGALLIHRGVLDMIDFTTDLADENKTHADTVFHQKLLQKGIPVHQVQKHIALHLNGDWGIVTKLINEDNNEKDNNEKR